jgi:hypothetical protein
MEVSAPTTAAAGDGLKALVSTVPGTLKSLQSQLNLPDTAYITSTVLSTDPEPEVVRSGQMRAGIVIGVGSIGVVLLLVALLDSLLQSRKRGTAGSRRRGMRAIPSRPANQATGGTLAEVATLRRPRPSPSRNRNDRAAGGDDPVSDDSVADSAHAFGSDTASETAAPPSLRVGRDTPNGSSYKRRLLKSG